MRWVVRQLIDNVVRWGLEFHGFSIGLGNHMDLRDLGDWYITRGDNICWLGCIEMEG